MIPKDLIAFIEYSRPEVLPGRKLLTDGLNFLLENNTCDNEVRQLDEAAALLEHWLIEELSKLGKLEIQGPEEPGDSWYVSVDDVAWLGDNLLAALWQAYKEVKEIK